MSTFIHNTIVGALPTEGKCHRSMKCASLTKIRLASIAQGLLGWAHAPASEAVQRVKG